MRDRPLHVGLTLALTIRGLAVASYAGMREVARTAETLGFDSVWLCDHFLTLATAAYARDAGIRPGTAPRAADDGATAMPLLECWTTLSALSRETQRLRLGTGVLCNSYRHPAVLGKMAATLDVISEGRVELGLGAGWFESEYRVYGIPFPPIGVRIDQLGEAIEVIRRMWSEPQPVFREVHYAIDGALCEPPPVQRPHPHLGGRRGRPGPSRRRPRGGRCERPLVVSGAGGGAAAVPGRRLRGGRPAQGDERARLAHAEGRAGVQDVARPAPALGEIAAGIPARVGFQQIHCPDKPFMSEEVRRLWGDRTLPWHSLGEAWLDGRWLKLDATIDSATANARGCPNAREFDGVHDIPTVEGPIVKELGSYADYPRDVAGWYEAVAREVMAALRGAEARTAVAADDRLWSGPDSARVRGAAPAP